MCCCATGAITVSLHGSNGLEVVMIASAWLNQLGWKCIRSVHVWLKKEWNVAA